MSKSFVDDNRKLLFVLNAIDAEVSTVSLSLDFNMNVEPLFSRSKFLPTSKAVLAALFIAYFDCEHRKLPRSL